MRKKKRRKGKKIAALLIVAVIILLAAGVLFLAMRQVNQLNDETAKIVRMDVDEDVIDEEIYTNGSYAEHQSNWKLEDGKLKFDSDDLLSQYNDLAAAISQQ